MGAYLHQQTNNTFEKSHRSLTMLNQDVHPLYYTDKQKKHYLLSNFLIGLVWFVSTCILYWIIEPIRDFLIVWALSSVTLAIGIFHNIINHQSILKDSIAYNEEGVIRFNTQTTNFIRYEEIKAVSRCLFSDEINIIGKNSSMKIPKHPVLFPPFYEQLENKIYNHWVAQTTADGLTIRLGQKARFFRKVGMLIAIGLPFFLFSEHFFFWIIYSMILYGAYLQIKNHLVFSKEHIKVFNYFDHQHQLFRVNKIYAIDYNRSFGGRVIIEFESGENTLVFYSWNLNFPARTLFRFLKTRYGLTSKENMISKQ